MRFKVHSQSICWHRLLALQAYLIAKDELWEDMKISKISESCFHLSWLYEQEIAVYSSSWLYKALFLHSRYDSQLFLCFLSFPLPIDIFRQSILILFSLVLNTLLMIWSVGCLTRKLFGGIFQPLKLPSICEYSLNLII